MLKIEGFVILHTVNSIDIVINILNLFEMDSSDHVFNKINQMSSSRPTPNEAITRIPASNTVLKKGLT